MLDELRALLDKLCEADPCTLGDEEAVIALHRERSRLDAVTTRATAWFEAGGTWQHGGARSASIWVAFRCGLPRSEAKAEVALGRGLRQLPVAEAAWLAGDIAG
ncbi:MAG: hypothetical protein ACRD1K_13830, partial [Acidimicrobiales bacterium]